VCEKLYIFDEEWMFFGVSIIIIVSVFARPQKEEEGQMIMSAMALHSGEENVV
jgi:hypothetical protein